MLRIMTYCLVAKVHRRFNSTETALLRLHYDLLKQMESRRITAFIGLDLSAAFDTVDHTILLSVLQNRFGIADDVSTWIQSYLQSRSFSVHTLGASSKHRLMGD